GTLVTPHTARIDIRPGCDSNWVQPGAPGTVPVVIFGEAQFDVTGINGASLKLNGDPASCSTVSDVDGDTKQDLIAYFPMATLKVSPAATVGLLTGSMSADNQAINGSDSLTVVHK